MLISMDDVLGEEEDMVLDFLRLASGYFSAEYLTCNNLPVAVLYSKQTSVYSASFYQRACSVPSSRAGALR